MGVAKTETCVVASTLERGSGVVEVLGRLEVPVRFEERKVGDYEVGGVVIERLTAGEFERLAASGRLQEMAKTLATAGTPVIVVEGVLNMREWGELVASLALQGVNILRTSGAEETAHVVYAFYRRATARKKRGYLPPSKIRRKRISNLAEAQVSLLTAIPGIGRETARKLLLHFKTPRRVLTAPFHELEKIIGRARARRLTDTLDTIYPKALGGASLTGGYDQPSDRCSGS